MQLYIPSRRPGARSAGLHSARPLRPRGCRSGCRTPSRPCRAPQAAPRTWKDEPRSALWLRAERHSRACVDRKTDGRSRVLSSLGRAEHATQEREPNEVQLCDCLFELPHLVPTLLPAAADLLPPAFPVPPVAAGRAATAAAVWLLLQDCWRDGLHGTEQDGSSRLHYCHSVTGGERAGGRKKRRRWRRRRRLRRRRHCTGSAGGWSSGGVGG